MDSGSGDDFLYGGDGDDDLDGADNDWIDAGAGDDTVDADDGDDIIFGGPGTDAIDAGAGRPRSPTTMTRSSTSSAGSAASCGGYCGRRIPVAGHLGREEDISHRDAEAQRRRWSPTLAWFTGGHSGGSQLIDRLSAAPRSSSNWSLCLCPSLWLIHSVDLRFIVPIPRRY